MDILATAAQIKSSNKGKKRPINIDLWNDKHKKKLKDSGQVWTGRNGITHPAKVPPQEVS